MTIFRHTWLNLPVGALATLALASSGCNPPANQGPNPNSAAPSGDKPNTPEKPVEKKPGEEKPVSEKPATPPGGEGAKKWKVSLQPADLTSFQRTVAMQRGKVVLVDFWASWCDPCKELFPHTMEVARKYPAKDVVVITMSFDDASDEKSKGEALKFLEANQATGINLITSLGVAEGFDAHQVPGGAIPYYQLYDRNGTLRHEFKSGPDEEPIKPENVDLKIKELLMEKEPPMEKGGKVSSVTGTVTMDGKPLGNGTVTFVPVGDGVAASAAIGADGRFSIAPGSKLSPGNYVVTIVVLAPPAAESPPASLLPAKYSSAATSDLRVTIKPDENVFTLQLQSK